LLLHGGRLISGSRRFIHGGRFDERRLVVLGVRLIIVLGDVFRRGKLDQFWLIGFGCSERGAFERGSFFGNDLLFRTREVGSV
jgi:hypothetical protein